MSNEGKIYDGCIYMITNLINNKSYIGQSTKIEDVINRKYRGSGSIIALAIKKYKWSNFKTEILEYCSTVKELNDKEPFWIEKLSTLTPNGYNIKKGGEQGGPGNKMSLESKQKCKDNSFRKGKPAWNRGISMSDEMKKKMSNYNKGEKNYFYGKKLSGELNGMYGKNHTEKFKSEFSESRKGHGNPAFGRIWINDGINNKYIKKEEFSLFPNWILGRIIKKKFI